MVKKEASGGVVGRLATRGEEATARFMDALGKNHLVTDALAKAVSAKGKLDSGSRTALNQIGLATLDEVKDVRKQVATLEKRLAKLETTSAASAKKRAGTTATGKSTGEPTTRAKKTAEQTVSPPTGRAIGGGSARGAG
jgi:hypothetical protein